MTTFQLVCVLLLKIDGIFSSHIRYLSLFKTNCLIERGVCYEKNISYYSTYKLNIIADKMKKKKKYHTVANSSKSNRKIVERDKGDTVSTQNINT